MRPNPVMELGAQVALFVPPGAVVNSSHGSLFQGAESKELGLQGQPYWASDRL